MEKLQRMASRKETVENKAKEGQQAPQAVPQLLKRDGQVYVREVNGEEHAAKLIKTEDGRIFAEYMVVNEQTGEILPKRIPLRKKAKAEGGEEQPRPSMPARGKSRKEGDETEVTGPSLLERMVSKKPEPAKTGLSHGQSMKAARDEAMRAMADEEEGGEEEAEQAVEDEGDIEEFIDDLGRKDIRFKQVWTTAESLVLNYLIDDHLRIDQQSDPATGNAPAADPGDKRGRRKSTAADPWEGAFRWKENEAADEAFDPIVAEDDFEGVEARDDGVFPSTFNMEVYQKRRSGAPFYDVYPSNFRQARLNRPLDSFPPNEKISSLNELQSFTDPNREQMIKVIMIDEPVNLTKSTESQFLFSINRFRHCEILILRNIGIRHVELLQLPRLLAADFVDNKIGEVKNLTTLCGNCPHLFQLDVRRNPIHNRNYLPSLLAEGTSLRWVSGSMVSENDRYMAVTKHGTEMAKKLFRSSKAWELALQKVPPILQMSEWQPQQLKHLKLSNLGLERVFVGTMTELVTLDFSGNNITTIQLSGFEKLSKLMALNISKNKISDTADLEVLQYIPSLRVLMLAGNPLPENYRSSVLWICRNLKGKNHWPGLVDIDGKKVTRSDITEAWRLFGESSSADLEKLDWQLNLISYFGHYHLRLSGFTGRIANINFRGKGLKFADVSAFVNLQILDLAKNDILAIKGLDCLPYLRLLNLSGNPNLSLPSVLSSLRPTSGLWEIALAPSKKIADDVKGPYRMSIIDALFHHHQLRVIDGYAIKMEERMSAFSRVYPKAAGRDAETYALNLKITYSAVPAEGRKYTPKYVAPGVQWKEAEVQRLTDLCGLGISNHTTVDFTAFVNLRQLNLSHNNIKDITALKLQTLQSLAILDVSSNNISNGLAQLADYFDEFPALEVLCIRNNPCVRTPKDRLALIGLMKTFRKMDCKLSVVDIRVGVAERMDAWKAHGGKETEAEALKLKFQLIDRLPLNLPHEEVFSINLNNAKLSAMTNLTQFRNIETLLLRQNEIKSIRPVKDLKTLKLLDVRENKIQSMEDLLEVVNELPLLEVVAASGNPFNTGKNFRKYRASFINGVPRLRQIENFLLYLDDVELSASEIATTIFPTPKTPQEQANIDRWIWATCVWRTRQRFSLSSTANITEVDLSFQTLKSLHLPAPQEVALSMVKKLSLQGNRLPGPAIKYIDTLQELEELDLSGNNITDLQVLADLVDSLPKLKLLNIDDNPCCRDDSDGLRIAFLSRVKQIEYLGAPLRYLNGSLIAVPERIRGLELSKRSGFDESKIRIFRTELALEAIRAEVDTTRIMLGGFDLKSLVPLLAYKGLEILDLSNNSLESLADQGLETLENLFWLDLRKNNFASLVDDVLKPLSGCHKIKHIYLQQCTKTAETAKVADYILNPVCHTLRAIESCDQTKNPIKLTAEGEKGAEYLNSRFGLSRNGLLEINLNGRQLDERELPRFCTALSLVYCENLRCSDNPWFKASNYRFLLIYFCKTLIELDGSRIEMDERANAQRMVNTMKLDKKLFALERAAYGTYMATQVANKAESASTADAVAGKADGLADIDVGALQSVGSVLSKYEIIINYLQVFASLFTMTINWPGWWYDLNIRWVYIVNIDLDLQFLSYLQSFQYIIKFLVLLVLPFAIFGIYKIDPKENIFHSYYVDQYRLSWWIHAIEIIPMVIFAVFLGFLLDYYIEPSDIVNSWDGVAQGTNTKGLTDSIISACVAILSFVWLFRHVVMLLYRKYHESTTFWFNFIKIKKKVALFLLTICYQPIARNVMTHFASVSYKYRSSSNTWTQDKQVYDYPQCMSNTERVTGNFTDGDSFCCQRGVPDRPCLGQWEWFHIVSIIFLSFYTFGIPFIIYKLILRGTYEIDHNYNVPALLEDQKEKEKKWKEQLKTDISKAEKKAIRKDRKKSRKFVKNTWARYCREYTNAQNYLYFAYTRNRRYTKVFIMVEKLLLLAVILFFRSAAIETWRTLAGFVVVACYFFAFLFSQPYSDGMEDMMDVSGRLANSINAFAGIIGDHFGLSPSATNYFQSFILSIVNGTNVAILLGITFASPFVAMYTRYKLRRLEKRRQSLALEKPIEMTNSDAQRASNDRRNSNDAARNKHAIVEMPLIKTPQPPPVSDTVPAPSGVAFTSQSPTAAEEAPVAPLAIVRQKTHRRSKSRGILHKDADVMALNQDDEDLVPDSPSYARTARYNKDDLKSAKPPPPPVMDDDMVDDPDDVSELQLSHRPTQSPHPPHTAHTTAESDYADAAASTPASKKE